MNNSELDTPLMRQYLEIKRQHQDSILFFRLGDFYEMFLDDAEQAAPILDIALTTRDKNSPSPVPLCGVPYHSAQTYISKLLDKGFKVAICEQVEDASLSKGIVRREVVRIITPGLRTESEGAVEGEHNPLVSLAKVDHQFALAWLDVQSGQFWVAHFPQASDVENELLRLQPNEIVYPEHDAATHELLSQLRDRLGLKHLQALPSWVYNRPVAKICQRFQLAHIDGLGLEKAEAQCFPAAAVLHYVETINKTALAHLQPPKPYRLSHYVHVDAATRKHLELFCDEMRGDQRHSLFAVLDQTQTKMGRRKLKDWLHFPLRQVSEIEQRFNQVEALVQNAQALDAITSELAKLCDVERMVGKIANARYQARDLLAVRATLATIPLIRQILQAVDCTELRQLAAELNEHNSIYTLLSQSLVEELPLSTKASMVVREGFDPVLDQARQLRLSGKTWIAALEQQERTATGISSLKIGYNRVFGYYIEVTKSHLAKVPEHYMRKQTLANAERFVTPQLKQQEEQLLEAEQQAEHLEQKILASVGQQVAQCYESLQTLAEQLATLDVLAGFAVAAQRYNYVRPTWHQDQYSLDIEQGRHPVVERFLSAGSFVSNDISLNQQDRQIIVLTGPNMAGKSTIMRQVALTILMAQVGCFVPAKAATLSVVDQIFTRVGASDDLVGGRSTFMVEMSETANILRNATAQSLIVMDEIGRGTSTFDGLAIAWAVVEDLHDRVGAKTLFATHYHELTDLAQIKPRLCNMHVSVKEWHGQIVFLRQLLPGGVNRSYGVDVAQLAGVLPSVIARSRQVLTVLERNETDLLSLLTHGPTQLPDRVALEPSKLFNPQLTEVQTDLVESWLTQLHSLPLDTMAPRDALDLLYQWQHRYKIEK